MNRIELILTILVITIFLVGVLTAFIPWRDRPLRTGTRSYYAEDRYLLAYVHGDYLGDCFVPSMNVLYYLNQEQIDNIVLVETIPDKLK